MEEIAQMKKEIKKLERKLRYWAEKERKECDIDKNKANFYIWNETYRRLSSLKVSYAYRKSIENKRLQWNGEFLVFNGKKYTSNHVIDLVVALQQDGFHVELHCVAGKGNDRCYNAVVSREMKCFATPFKALAYAVMEYRTSN